MSNYPRFQEWPDVYGHQIAAHLSPNDSHNKDFNRMRKFHKRHFGAILFMMRDGGSHAH